MRDMFAKKDLPYKRDSCSILRNNGNNQDLSPNLSAQGSVHLNSNCDTESQSAKTCNLDGLSTQMSCPVDGNTVSHASMNGATDYSSQRSSPLCMDGVCLNPEGKHSAEMVASLNSNHSKSSYPCDLKGGRKNNFSSKYDVKVEACGPIIDGQNFITMENIEKSINFQSNQLRVLGLIETPVLVMTKVCQGVSMQQVETWNFNTNALRIRCLGMLKTKALIEALKIQN